MNSRYVDNTYRIVNPGEHLWTYTYKYSSKSLKCTSFRKPVEIILGDDLTITHVPGYKGRKLSPYYLGYFYTTEQLANQAFETSLKLHLLSIQNTVESAIESLQALCKRDQHIQSMREVYDIKQSLLNYAQVL